MNGAVDVSQAGPENGDSGCQAKQTDDGPMTGTSQKTRGGADSRVRKPSKYLSYPYTSSGLESFPAETEGTPKESLLSTKLDTKSEMKRKKTKTDNAARRKMKSLSGPSDTNTNASKGDHTSSGKELKQKRKMEKMTSLHQLQNEEMTVNETGNKCSLVPEISQNHSSLASKKKQKLDVAQLHQGAQFVWHLDAKGTECSPLVVDLQNKGIGENKEEQVSKISNPPAAVAPSFEHFMIPPLDMHNKIIGENKEEQVPKVSNPPGSVAPPMEHFITSPLKLQNKRIGENKEEQVPKVSYPPAAVAPPMEHFMTSPLDLQNKSIGEIKEEHVPKVSNHPAAVAPPLEHLMTPLLDLQNKIIGENKEQQVPKVSNPPATVAPPMENFMTSLLDLQNKSIGENKEEQVPKVSNPPAAAAPPMEHLMASPLDLQNKSIGENKEEHVPKVSNHPAAVAPPLEHLTPTQPTRPMSMSVETSPTLQLFDQILHKMSLVLEKLRE